MPVYVASEQDSALGAVAQWVEIDEFQCLQLSEATPLYESAPRRDGNQREAMIVTAGTVVASYDGGRVTLQRNDWLETPAAGMSVRRVRRDLYDPPAELVVFRGKWASLSDVSVFRASQDRPVERHYHDFHEYWLIFRGRGTCSTESMRYAIAPGSVVATAMGSEHDLAVVDEVIEGVGVETALMGLRRTGHLHRGGDGESEPAGA